MEFSISLVHPAGQAIDLKALAAWTRPIGAFAKPLAYGDGLCWDYANTATGAVFSLTWRPEPGLMLSLPLPQPMVLAGEILLALEDLNRRFDLALPAKIVFEGENARSLTFLEQFRQANHACLTLMAQRLKPENLPPVMAPAAAKAWWDYTMDAPAFDKRIGAEVQVGALMLLQGETGEALQTALAWDGSRGLLMPAADMIQITQVRRNWLGKVVEETTGLAPFSLVRERLRELLTAVGAPYPLSLLPFKHRERAVRLLQDIKALAPVHQFRTISPGAFIDDPP